MDICVEGRYVYDSMYVLIAYGDQGGAFLLFEFQIHANSQELWQCLKARQAAVEQLSEVGPLDDDCRGAVDLRLYGNNN